MQRSVFTILENTPAARGVYRMRLAGDTSALTRPGQFVNVRVEGFFLRRPISVCDREEGELTLLYKVVGEGTAAMAALPEGAKLDLLTGLGNGFDAAKAGERPLLIGGGMGAAPMLWLAKELVARGTKPRALLGFASKEDVVLEEELRAAGCEVSVATVDGSHGTKGFVTALMGDPSTYFYACGPEPMLRAVDKAAVNSGEFSFEERMGCGFGACMGCSCKTKYGAKRICKDGPVLSREAVIW